MNWQTLIEQKRKELPAIQEKHSKEVNRVVDTMEKRLYNLCKKQEAGRECVYFFEDLSSNRVMQFLDSLGFVIQPDWDFQEECFKVLSKRLESAGVNHSVGIELKNMITVTLP